MLKNLKWIIFGESVGIASMFIAGCLPEKYSEIKNYLLVFGSSVSLGYLIELVKNVYLPLKDEEE